MAQLTASWLLDIKLLSLTLLFPPLPPPPAQPVVPSKHQCVLGSTLMKGQKWHEDLQNLRTMT